MTDPNPSPTEQRTSLRIAARHGSARVGLLNVRGRCTPTPAFLPVGTQGTVKGIYGPDLLGFGYRAALANTYHLHLRPGEDVIADLGGLHRVMGFPGILLTDSGGYQVFSLAERRRLTDDGVWFQSHLDGTKIELTPERAMEIQHALDSDIAMVLDECPAADADDATHRRAVERSLHWAERSLRRHRELGNERAAFAIVQGGDDLARRREMAAELCRADFDGFALGGIGVGEARSVVRRQIAGFAELLPEHRPRYLMGVASPAELFLAVRSGIDLFDCVLPTRNARNGHLYTRDGVVKIRNAAHARDRAPLESDCPCRACRTYSRGTLRHLFQAGEILASVLATEHNLVFFARFLADVRQWIERPDSVDLSWVEQHYGARDGAAG